MTPSSPASPARGPAVAVASPARKNGSGQALEKRNRRGRAGPGCEGPAVEVAEVAETGHPPQRTAPSLFSLRVVARECWAQ